LAFSRFVIRGIFGHDTNLRPPHHHRQYSVAVHDPVSVDQSPSPPLFSVMALYTIFAWTAIVIVGAAYYWIYIRHAPLPAHLIGLSSKPHSRDSTTEEIALTGPTKRKRKTVPAKKRPVVAQTNELIASTNGISGDESDEGGASKSQVQEERRGVVQLKSLKGTSKTKLYSD